MTKIYLIILLLTNIFPFSAPDVKNVKITAVSLSNTSVTLQWSPPKLTNGVVRYYHVHYYLDDLLQQPDSTDSLKVLQSMNERHVEVHDTKVRTLRKQYYLQTKNYKASKTFV